MLSVLRGLPRILLLALLGLVNLAASYAPELLDWRGGLMVDLVPLCLRTGYVFLGLAAGDLALRILQPGVDAHQAARAALRGNTGAGLAYLGRSLLLAIVLLLMATATRAGQVPAAALPLLPVLKTEQRAWWPDVPEPATLAGQIEQETCPSLTHRMCWSTRAELRTAREHGVGLGQFTRAFRPDGSTRFDALAEIVQAHPLQLAGLSWESRYDPVLQIRALVLRNAQGWRLVQAAASPSDRLAMVYAGHNGGAGGLASDRRACAATPGCDPGRWFGHVEHTSLKARTAVAGYGKSFFAINREYVRNVMLVRSAKYAAFL